MGLVFGHREQPLSEEGNLFAILMSMVKNVMGSCRSPSNRQAWHQPQSADRYVADAAPMRYRPATIENASISTFVLHVDDGKMEGRNISPCGFMGRRFDEDMTEQIFGRVIPRAT